MPTIKKMISIRGDKIKDVRAGYIENPKTKGSGIVCAIPQIGECPNKCDDCFFQSGRSYLEPLNKNLPNLPIPADVWNKVVRVNDGNDSNVDRKFVDDIAQCYDNYFFFFFINKDLDKFSGPVVLTVNPSKKTDKSFFTVEPIPKNLMFVRVRVNTWNVESVVIPAVEYYTKYGVPVIFTFMAYYTKTIRKGHENDYEWKKRTLNSYWVISSQAKDTIMRLFEDNALVYECGYKESHSCMRCGNCLREYFNTMERMKEGDDND